MLQLVLAVCLAAATSHAIPMGIATSLHDSATTLTSIVVADIDRDGDADVVATDDALHLFVWINDGTGHLTQQRPASPTGRAMDGGGPDIEGRGRASEPSTPSDPPVVDAHVDSSAAAPLAWSRVTRLSADRHRGDVPATERLRGPPAASPLR